MHKNETAEKVSGRSQGPIARRPFLWLAGAAAGGNLVARNAFAADRGRTSRSPSS